jgi:hypothetical protein
LTGLQIWAQLLGGADGGSREEKYVAILKEREETEKDG